MVHRIGLRHNVGLGNDDVWQDVPDREIVLLGVDVLDDHLAAPPDGIEQDVRHGVLLVGLGAAEQSDGRARLGGNEPLEKAEVAPLGGSVESHIATVGQSDAEPCRGEGFHFVGLRELRDAGKHEVQRLGSEGLAGVRSAIDYVQPCAEVETSFLDVRSGEGQMPNDNSRGAHGPSPASRRGWNSAVHLPMRSSTTVRISSVEKAPNRFPSHSARRLSSTVYGA